MGYHYSSYLAYGVRVYVNAYEYTEDGKSVEDLVSDALSVPTVKEACPDVGTLLAGDYDQDMLFLVTSCESAELGFQRVAFQETEPSWAAQLTRLAEVMGWTQHIDASTIGWFVVTDCS